MHKILAPKANIAKSQGLTTREHHWKALLALPPPWTYTQEFLLDCYFHHLHCVYVTVAERLEAHKFCSTARRVSC